MFRDRSAGKFRPPGNGAAAGRDEEVGRDPEEKGVELLVELVQRHPVLAQPGGPAEEKIFRRQKTTFQEMLDLDRLTLPLTVRTRQPGFDVPVYGLPSDLIRAKAGDAPANANGTMPLGRYDRDGKFVPYFDRAEIDDGGSAKIVTGVTEIGEGILTVLAQIAAHEMGVKPEHVVIGDNDTARAPEAASSADCAGSAGSAALK